MSKRPTATVKSPLKWAGTKKNVLDTVFDKFPTEIENYCEPFLGGGSILCELLERIDSGKISVKNIFVNDFNKALIGLYKNIKYNINELIETLDDVQDDFLAADDKDKRKEVEYIEDAIENGKKCVYYYYRKIYNKHLEDNTIDDIECSALFLVLNKTCFHGIYKVGKDGLFNNGFGFAAKVKSNCLYDKEMLIKLSKIFNKHNVTFECKDFVEFLDDNLQSDKDFVYMDPPYYPDQKNTFTSYTKDSFADKHDLLVEICNNLDGNNIKFIESNSVTDYIFDKYKNFNIQTINAKSKGKSRNEVLIWNF